MTQNKLPKNQHSVLLALFIRWHVAKVFKRRGYVVLSARLNKDKTLRVKFSKGPLGLTSVNYGKTSTILILKGANLCT